MRKRKLEAIAVVLMLGMFMAGCAARPLHPGAANAFDSSAYDALLVADNIIQTTKTDLASNAFPANIAPAVKTALNNMITAYNVADISYKAYHAAAIAGTATPAQQQAVTDGLNQVSTTTTVLVNAKGGK